MRSLFLVAFLAIASLQGTFAAPCAQGLSSWVIRFLGNNIGWPDYPMDNHPLGTPSSEVPSSAADPDYEEQYSTSVEDSSDFVSSSDIQAYLSAHNSFRAKHGAAPLAWSNSLSSVAQSWANGCKFKHSGGKNGENLAAGTGSGYGIPQAIKSWTDESSQYNPRHPVPSHFTQVVWKSTTHVGCAHQNCSGIFKGFIAHYHVCEYSPPGNVIGQFPKNVQ